MGTSSKLLRESISGGVLARGLYHWLASWARAPPVSKHGPRSATLGQVCGDEAVRRRETDSPLLRVFSFEKDERGASHTLLTTIYLWLGEGAELKRGYPIARDLRVGRRKPLETAVEVRSSADPQIACVTCA